jgi:tyrosinase
MAKFTLLGLAAAGSVAALNIPLPHISISIPTGAPKIPIKAFETLHSITLSLKDISAMVANQTDGPGPETEFTPFAAQAACSSVKTRVEWHDSSDQTKQNFVDGVKCLLGKSSKGGYPGSKNRYEDFVQVHQSVTDNVHNNRKFIVWHRAFLWTFEQVLRNECGFTDSVPWFDESKFAGRFAQSSIFSKKWLGSIGINGNCVTDGQFANLALNVGPNVAKYNQYHCLARNGNAADTANTNADIVNGCRQLKDYQDFAKCAEQGAHAYGHNGIGGVMRDVYASPGDPVFWLHHAMVDRHFRIWQNDDSSRTGYIDGTSTGGAPLTLDTDIVLNGLGPTMKVRDVMNTLSSPLCYKYSY